MGSYENDKPDNDADPLTPEDEERARHFLDLVDGQTDRADETLRMRPTRRPRFKPERLYKITRAMAPGQLWLVTANTGIGKTTFLLSAIDDFVQQGYKVALLGLEEHAHDLRTAFACLRAGVPWYVARENSWAEYRNGADMLADVRRHLWLQAEPPLNSQFVILPYRHIDGRALVEAAEEAAYFGADLFVVDHLHHIKGGFNYEKFSQIVLLSKEIAENYDFVNLSAAQMNREAMKGGHRLTRYMPAQLHQIQGGGVIEQNASVVLNLYRPIIKPETKRDAELIKLAMRGEVEPIEVLQPDRMGVAVLKHRPRGYLEGKRCVLQLVDGKLIDVPEDMLS